MKKTNYQRLYRNVLKESRVNHNFAEEVIAAATRIWEDKKIKNEDKLTEFQKYVAEIRELNKKALSV